MIHKQLQNAFLGNDISFKNCEGETVKRVYLDTAASCLALKPSLKITEKYLKYYSNTHSTVHLTANISNQIFAWASNKIMSFLSADDSYTSIFIGSGTTAVINRITKGLNKLRPDKKTIILSAMEHHSNDLPHRIHNNKVIHLPVVNNKTGEFIGIDLNSLEEILIKENGNVNYISITAASNVTGDMTPFHKIAKLAHKYDAYIIVDGAQLVAHHQVKMDPFKDDSHIDFFAFSGHKIYAPGSPGVLIAKKELINKMQPLYYGGGMVKEVSLDKYELKKEAIERENAGTPNLPGILNIATVMTFMNSLGMDYITKKEKELLTYMLEELSKIDNLKIYSNHTHNKVGVVSFNIKNIPHQLLAKILNDFFGIAVRNDCFCAHPIVREYLLDELWNIEDDKNIDMYKGMVRASLGLHSTKEDIDKLTESLKKITSNKNYYTINYKLVNDQYINLKEKSIDIFNIEKEINLCFKPYLTTQQ